MIMATIRKTRHNVVIIIDTTSIVLAVDMIADGDEDIDVISVSVVIFLDVDAQF
jgi:hypothetical protein